MKHKTFLVEFFLTALLFWLSTTSFLVLYHAYFGVGLIIGGVVVKVNSRYYIHEGLIFLGALMALLIIFIYLLQDNPSENRWIAFILGTAGSLLLLPLYARILNTFSAKVTTVTTIAFIAVLFILIAFVGTFLKSSSLLVVLSVGVALYLLFSYRGMMFWLCLEWIIKLRYKVVYDGTEHLTDEGALLFISNHISWIDWIVVQLPVKHRIHYMVNKNLFNKWFFTPLVRINECIPISKNSFREGIRQGRKLLKRNDIVGMCPEGSISKTGELGRFYRGFEFLDGEYDGKIVPVYIDGLWGSILSRSKKKFCNEKSGFRRVVRVTFGPLLPLNTPAIEVKQAIEKMKESCNKKTV